MTSWPKLFNQGAIILIRQFLANLICQTMIKNERALKVFRIFVVCFMWLVD